MNGTEKNDDAKTETKIEHADTVNVEAGDKPAAEPEAGDTDAADTDAKA